MYTKNEMSAKLNLFGELMQIYHCSWHQKQEVRDYLYSTQKVSFGLASPHVNLRTLGGDNHVQNSHVTQGEKMPSGEVQNTCRCFSSLTWHYPLTQTKQVSLYLSILSSGQAFPTIFVHLTSLGVFIIVKFTQITIKTQTIHLRYYDRTFQLQTSKQILQSKQSFQQCFCIFNL